MTNDIILVGDHYAAIRDGKVIGVVQKSRIQASPSTSIYIAPAWSWCPFQGVGAEYTSLEGALRLARECHP